MKQAPEITFKMLTKKLKEKDGFPFSRLIGGLMNIPE